MLQDVSESFRLLQNKNISLSKSICTILKHNLQKNYGQSDLLTKLFANMLVTLSINCQKCAPKLHRKVTKIVQFYILNYICIFYCLITHQTGNKCSHVSNIGYTYLTSTSTSSTRVKK